jgi:hypothetical protein
MLARAGEVEERLGHLGHLLTYRPRYALEEVLNLVGVQSVCDVDSVFTSTDSGQGAW